MEGFTRHELFHSGFDELKQFFVVLVHLVLQTVHFFLVVFFLKFESVLKFSNLISKVQFFMDILCVFSFSINME